MFLNKVWFIFSADEKQQQSLYNLAAVYILQQFWNVYKRKIFSFFAIKNAMSGTEKEMNTVA